jgi:hypothetical protein
MKVRFARSRRGFALAVAAVVAAAVFTGSAAFASPTAAHVRVEGASATLFSGTVSGGPVTITDSAAGTHTVDGSAMWALALASRGAGLSCVYTNSAWGVFVDSIAGESMVPAPPYPGWLYRVNGVSPLVGATEYDLAEGDDVLWYYGTYDSSPTALVVPAGRVATGSSVRVVVNQLDAAGVATPLPGATVVVGDREMTSDASGAVTFVPQVAGDFGVRATKAGCVRSALETLRVRETTRITGTSAPAAAARGGRVAVTAKLVAGTSALPGRTVVLQRRVGKGAWKRIATAVTGTGGNVRATVRVSASASYRFVFAGDATYLAATGTPVSVRAR